MKRQRVVQEIFQITKDKNLNMSTMVFLVAMTSDKGVSKLLAQLKNVEIKKKDSIPEEFDKNM